MAGRGGAGGIFTLLELIEERRGPLEYDFRTRFHLPLSTVGREMAWGEAIRLIRIIRSDPSSMLTAAVEGWTHPVSREAAIAMDQYDLTYAATGAKKPHRYPRPFKTDDRERRKLGNAAGRSNDETRAILRRFAEGAPV